MATIAVDTFLDGGTARTAGEAWTINSGAKLTIRTDTRVHANAPASMTGSLGSVTINEGEVIIDARNVRWLAYNTGTGNVPAIGTTISQGGVSGYLLGVWASLTSAPTAAAAAMPATGFIKLREVSGGTFAAGALTGIGASATGADVTGWIEVVHDDAADITVPRLGKYTTRGDWFYLGNTTGTRGQVIQAPTNGGGNNTHVPGIWVETAPGSGVYDRWRSVLGSGAGWSIVELGEAEGSTDIRQKFYKALTNGQIQFGETLTIATATYASIAAQASTYADWSMSGTYTWSGDVVRIYVAAGHTLFGGESVGLDFTSGDGVDQIVTVETDGPYYLTATIAGSGAGGNVTVRPGVKVTFASHGLADGNQVGCTVSTGTLPTGTYTVHSVESSNVYYLTYPSITAVTGGNVSCLHTIQVTRASHGLTVGRRVYLSFTSGAATNGTYAIRTTATGTYNVNWPHFATTSGNVTERFDLGFVPPAGCKVRIPNVLARSCATASRATNSVPNTTWTTRPEFITTTAGAIDLEFFCGHWRTNFTNAYTVRAYNCAMTEQLNLSTVAGALDINNVVIGGYHWHSNNNATLEVSACLGGGTIKDVLAVRHASNSSYYHAFRVSYCYGLTIDGVTWGYSTYGAGAEPGLTVSYSSSCTIKNTRSINGELRLIACQNSRVENHDHNNNLIGQTSSANSRTCVSIDPGCYNVTVDGVTFGHNGVVPNTHTYNQAIYIRGSDTIKVRNVGTPANPLPMGTWERTVHGLGYFFQSGGSITNIKFQRCYVVGSRTRDAIYTINTDSGIVLENVGIKEPNAWVYNNVRYFTPTMAAVNADVKGLSSDPALYGFSSVYGSHFQSLFSGKTVGYVSLCMNEPTTKTAGYFTMVSGTAKFNSAGGILMATIGNQAVWETKDWIIGHTGFQNVGPTMLGGTIGNYTLEYQIDTGSGYSAWKTLNGTNLSGETISPATGFKLKIRITTTTTNTTAITYLNLATTTTPAAQVDNLYPLDVNSLTITGLPTGCDAFVLSAGTNTVLDQRDSIGATSYTYTYSGAQNVDVGIIKPGYIPYYIRNLSLTAADSSIPVALTPDRNYA